MPDQHLNLMLRRLKRAMEPSGAGLADAELLARFVNANDQAAFEVLVWRHGGMVMGACRRVLRHEQDAEDAFQATFLTLARRARAIRRGAAIASWLYQVAYRIALASRTRMCVRAEREKPLGEGHCEPNPRVMAHLPRVEPILDEEVNRLPEKFREAVVLCYLEGKTNDEAARQLGCPRGTVASRLARARDRLQRRLRRRGIECISLTIAGIAGNNARSAPMLAKLINDTLKAVSGIAAGTAAPGLISPPVAALVQGALRTMMWNKVKFVVMCMALTVVGIGGTGVGALAMNGRGDRDQESGLTYSVGQDATAPRESGDSAEPVKRKRGPADAEMHAARMNSLKQILLAMHNYHSAYGHFPAPAIYGKDGQALLSWRVELLPFLDENDLYKQFNRNELWDSPHNRELAKKMPEVFANGLNRKGNQSTFCQVVVGPGAAFEKDKQLKIASFTDGTSNTLMVVEAATAVPWTKPEDVAFDPDLPLSERLTGHKDIFHLAMADGSVNTVQPNFDRKEFRSLITRDGGEVLNADSALLRPPGKPARERDQTNVQGLIPSIQVLREEVIALRQEVDKLKREVRALKEK